VALSSLLPSTADTAWPECRAFETAYEKLRPASGSKTLTVLEKADAEFASFAPVLKVAIPARSLAATYQETLGTAVAP
jgi:hypothetical protein